MKFKLFLLLILPFLAIAACKNKPAVIVNNSKNYFGKNSSYNQNKYDLARKKTYPSPYSTAASEKIVEKNLDDRTIAQSSANKEITNKEIVKSSEKIVPVKEVGENKISVSSGEVIVAPGDTLHSIAKKYNVPLRDLIEQNNLTPPYKLNAQTRLTLPQSVYYEVKNGDTLYSISRAHNMKIDAIIALNGLTAPYQVKLGQQIKISNSAKIAEQKEVKNQVATAPSSAAVKTEKPIVIGDAAEKKLADNKVVNINEKILENKNNKFTWPLKGNIISKFGPKTGGLYNDGVNIKAKEGSSVKSSEDGVVAYVGNELKGYGNLIIIKHSGGWITAYAHLSKMNVKRGDKIKKAQIIGNVGSTGNVNSSQLYFGLRKGRDAVNPENYIAKI